MQIKDKVYYNEDFFKKNSELDEILDYLENIYCTEFYIYHSIYKKAFSYNIVKKMLGKDTCYIYNKYSIVSVIQENSQYTRIFFNNDWLLRQQGKKELFVYVEGNCRSYEINENKHAVGNSLVHLDIWDIGQDEEWDSMRVYCGENMIDVIFLNENMV